MKVYFIGIGGSGMLPLAHLASASGHEVQGCDPRGQNQPGLTVFTDIDPRRIASVDAVVFSSAIPADHPELMAARMRSESGSLKIYHRMDFLREILSDHPVRIGIAGTHGKTSTTSIAGWVLLQIGMDPTIFAGGRPKYLAQGMRRGKDVAVFETDESDGSFLRSGANVRLALNVDRDHLDHYGDEQTLHDAFRRFATEGEIAVVNAEDEVLRHLPGTTYSTSAAIADYMGTFIGETDRLKVSYHGEQLGELSVALPGRHFASNALGLFALFDTLRRRGSLVFDPQIALEAVSTFPGVERRMELIGTTNGALIYDDYGHHPSEIAAVLRALQIRNPGKRIRIVFQPHRFTRTQEHGPGFARVLSIADECWLLPLYSAGEVPIPGVDSEWLVSLMGGRARMTSDPELPLLLKSAGPNDIVLFQGAGDVSYLGRNALKALGQA
ncbi:MAG: UDP-N-acetylmuramate--L-alanine ligase [Leptospirales bacterium]|nr:UDP-N-acetylmuramate--L-alanine ligase [Leptospirales bacterium]